MKENYYVCDKFDVNLYILLAKAGFISTSTKLNSEKIYLLPEIQFEYAVLEFKNLHKSKKVSKLLNKKEFKFQKTENLKSIIKHINDYHEHSWIEKNYEQMLLNITNKQQDNFELLAFELICTKTEEIVAGEIGYKIGKTYTSLSGFFKKEKQYNNYGKLQLVLLSKYLEKNFYDFWNLGHACLQYKVDLGAEILKRDIFLEKWYKSSTIA